MNKLIKISELSKMLNLVDPLTKKPSNHILRYWEKQFKDIKPKKINNIRYYSSKQVEINQSSWSNSNNHSPSHNIAALCLASPTLPPEFGIILCGFTL